MRNAALLLIVPGSKEPVNLAPYFEGILKELANYGPTGRCNYMHSQRAWVAYAYLGLWAVSCGVGVASGSSGGMGGGGGGIWGAVC
jgi:hypothetical protein